MPSTPLWAASAITFWASRCRRGRQKPEYRGLRLEFTHCIPTQADGRPARSSPGSSRCKRNAHMRLDGPQTIRERPAKSVVSTDCLKRAADRDPGARGNSRMPSVTKHHPKRHYGRVFPARQYDDLGGGWASALERNILRYRAHRSHAGQALCFTAARGGASSSRAAARRAVAQPR
jgi:hypothetical protein